MWTNLQFPVDLVAFTGEFLNKKLFLCKKHFCAMSEICVKNELVGSGLFKVKIDSIFIKNDQPVNYVLLPIWKSNPI